MVTFPRVDTALTMVSLSLSASLSLASTETATELPPTTVAVSSAATGASLTAAIVTFTVMLSAPPFPSLALSTKLSDPFSFAFGV